MKWDICIVHQLLSQQRECFSKEDQKTQRGTRAEVSYFCSYTEASFLLPRWHIQCASFPCNGLLWSPTTSNKGGLFFLKQGQEAQTQLFAFSDTQTIRHESASRLMGCSRKPFRTSPTLRYVGMPSMFVRKSAKSPVTPGNWRLYVLTEASLIPASVALQPKTQLSAFSSTTSETSVRRTSYIYRKLGKLASIPPHRLSESFFSGCDIVLKYWEKSFISQSHGVLERNQGPGNL